MPCRLRRTSARGWGPWVAGRLRLAGGSLPVADEPGGTAFLAEDPTQVSLVTGRSGHPGPIPIAGPAELARRPVRFTDEAFVGRRGRWPWRWRWGDPSGAGVEGEVMVLVSGRNTTEIVVSPPEVDAVAERLTGTLQAPDPDSP